MSIYVMIILNVNRIIKRTFNNANFCLKRRLSAGFSKNK
ncbi:hypothetical protein EZS27_007410 [termite gut metagenome]|uniref:Uncharacterized protein n=1 Tax=termite gut metagenome TaxID=433724 RepID=A0A5J4SI88_9ZZZZ